MWHLIWTHYAALVIGFIVGFLFCAMLATGSDRNTSKGEHHG
jgi:uncharacterized membrane-anchored protein YhcB (DUF1043 family)